MELVDLLRESNPASLLSSVIGFTGGFAVGYGSNGSLEPSQAKPVALTLVTSAGFGGLANMLREPSKTSFLWPGDDIQYYRDNPGNFFVEGAVRYAGVATLTASLGYVAGVLSRRTVDSLF